MSDSASSLQAWQGIAAIVGAAIGGFCVAIGRRAGSAASRSAETVPAGDALQREILGELRRLREDQRAQREADEDRRRDIKERAIDEQIDAIRRELRVRRVGQDNIKLMLTDVRDRLPPADRRGPAVAGDPTDVSPGEG